jgi:flagellar biosynthesis protein
LANPKSRTPNISPLPSTQEVIAVAIKQKDGPKQTPNVIAGGRGRVAEQILEVAFSQGIKVREDADLVQMLSVVDVDSEIPLEAFATVAEILTYVYEANNVMKPEHNADNQAPSAPSADEMVASWSANKGKLDD